MSGMLTGHATTPQTVGYPQPIVSFEYRVARVPASSAYVSNLDVSLVLAYSLGSKYVVTLRSASVMIQSVLSPKPLQGLLGSIG